MKKAFLLPLIPPSAAFLLCAALFFGAGARSVASVAPDAGYDVGYGVENAPGESTVNDARNNDARSAGVGDVFEEAENDAEDILNGATTVNDDDDGVGDGANADSTLEDENGGENDESNPVMLWIAVILAVALIAVVAALIPRKKNR